MCNYQQTPGTIPWNTWPPMPRLSCPPPRMAMMHWPWPGPPWCSPDYGMAQRNEQTSPGLPWMMPTIPWSLPNLMLPPCLPDGPNWPWCPQPPSPWPPNSLPDWPPIPMETRDKLLEFLRNELKDRTMPRANSDLELTINMSFTISELLLKVVNSEEGKSILKELDVQLKSITDTNPSLRYAGIIAGVAIGIIIGAVAGAAYEHYHHTHPQ